ncbi:MAG: hypothetical protein KGL39_32180 [Patescibacteria group bacterium]|nr:hypothetical protein [Patescibacteria group bacterium]
MAPQPASAPATHHPVGSPAWLVAQAKDLERERAALMEKIGANRNLLRQLHKVDALDDEMKRFVEQFYPEKEKGSNRSKDEIEATRKLREAARKA